MQEGVILEDLMYKMVILGWDSQAEEGLLTGGSSCKEVAIRHASQE